MKWFKFYGQDYLSDPKILSLSASERSCWITLLSYGSVNDNGMITFLDEEQLMAQSGISPMNEEWNCSKGVLNKLQKLKMITIDNGMITILNWNKRQETNLTSYERVKRYREKKRNDNANDNAKITLEENRIEEKRISYSSKMNDQNFQTFWQLYPKKVGKKKVEGIFLKLEQSLLPVILKAVEEQSKSEQWQDTKYIPHPTTWLTQGRWEDEKTMVGDPIEQEIQGWSKLGEGMALSRFMTKYYKTPEYSKLYFKYEKLLNL